MRDHARAVLPVADVIAAEQLLESCLLGDERQLEVLCEGVQVGHVAFPAAQEAQEGGDGAWQGWRGWKRREGKQEERKRRINGH